MTGSLGEGLREGATWTSSQPPRLGPSSRPTPCLGEADRSARRGPLSLPPCSVLPAFTRSGPPPDPDPNGLGDSLSYWPSCPAGLQGSLGMKARPAALSWSRPPGSRGAGHHRPCLPQLRVTVQVTPEGEAGGRGWGGGGGGQLTLGFFLESRVRIPAGSASPAPEGLG